MLCIFSGRPTPNGKHADKIAGELQNAHHLLLNGCRCEHSSTIENQKDGRHILIREKRLKLLDPIIQKLIRKDPTLIDNSLLEDVVISTSLDLSQRLILISPLLQKLNITINSFPDNFIFGNGTTVNYSLKYQTFLNLYDAQTLEQELTAKNYSTKIETSINPTNKMTLQYHLMLRISWCCICEAEKTVIESKWQEFCDLMEK